MSKAKEPEELQSLFKSQVFISPKVAEYFCLDPGCPIRIRMNIKGIPCIPPRPGLIWIMIEQSRSKQKYSVTLGDMDSLSTHEIVEGSSLEHVNIEDAPNFNHNWGRNAINFLENSCEVPVVPVESVPCTKNSIFQKQWQIMPAVGDRKDTNSSAGTSSHCFNKSVPASLQKCSNSNSWLFPGIVVWAKKANNEWWPAEVVDATSLLKCTGSYSIGQSLVKFFGDHKYAWLDPIRQISEFHAFYEERSQSHLKIFQDALHEALQKHSHSAPDISPRKCSASSDTEGSVSPSITEDQSSERRGKRKRKTKIHFDELMLSDKPVKRVRTTRIMRHLGLIAPVGSPFSHSRATSDAV